MEDASLLSPKSMLNDRWTCGLQQRVPICTVHSGGAGLAPHPARSGQAGPSVQLWVDDPVTESLLTSKPPGVFCYGLDCT